MEKNKIRLSESQLNKIIKESIASILNENHGFMDGIKGAFTGMKNGFDRGARGLETDDYMNRSYKSRNMVFVSCIADIYNILGRCNCQDANEMRTAIDQVKQCLKPAFKQLGWDTKSWQFYKNKYDQKTT